MGHGRAHGGQALTFCYELLVFTVRVLLLQCRHLASLSGAGFVGRIKFHSARSPDLLRLSSYRRDDEMPFALRGEFSRSSVGASAALAASRFPVPTRKLAFANGTSGVNDDVTHRRRLCRPP